MAYTKYSLTPADNNAAPPNGAPEGMLPSAVNDTMRDMMAQIRDVGDGIRGGTYTMTAPVITGGSITGVALSGNTFTSPIITGGSINNTPIGASTANTGAFTTLGATGVATFSAGSVSAPAITTTGDTNTGIFFPAADTIAFTEGGVESMRIDSSGNVGIGTSSPNATMQLNGSSAGLRITGVTNTSGLLLGVREDGQEVQLLNSANGAFRFGTNNTERMRIDSSGNVGIGTSSPGARLDINTGGSSNTMARFTSNGSYFTYILSSGVTSVFSADTNGFNAVQIRGASNQIECYTNGSERMRINSAGDVFVAKTAQNIANVGCELRAVGMGTFTNSGDVGLVVNRNTNDGDLVLFRQDNTTEGTISVSGTTVSYNGGHLSRWSQLPDGSKDESIVKGTVMSNLDDMCVWEKDGVVAENEQLNKIKVSDVEGDTNVAGVFVNWTKDEQYDVDDMNVAMTGDMIIRIAGGVVVQKGDLLMSAGDGTAKPQGDDIVRSKTVAKVTSNYVTCTYADGSYCVPCVLMAC